MRAIVERSGRGRASPRGERVLDGRRRARPHRVLGRSRAPLSPTSWIAASPFTASDAEAEDVDWINDASRALIHAVPPLEAARLTLQIAEETDARVAALPVDRLWPTDPDSPLYALRAAHRGEHLDDIEVALRK